MVSLREDLTFEARGLIFEGILGYCELGREVYGVANGGEAAAAAEHRIETALEAGEGLDTNLILLAHADESSPGNQRW